MAKKPNRGDLRVWWVPQVPMKSFQVPVANLIEARLLLDTLAAYDVFQLDNNIKPDFANAGGLSVWYPECADENGDAWVDWIDCDGETIDFYSLADLRKITPKWEGVEEFAARTT